MRVGIGVHLWRFFLLPSFRGLGAGYTNERMKQGGRGGEDIRGMWSLFHVYSSLHPRHRMRLYAYKDIPSFLVFEHKIACMQYLQKMLSYITSISHTNPLLMRSIILS